MLNARSLTFIFSLIALLMFIVGFRYGRKVDTAEKTYVPPTPRPEATSISFPTPTPFSQEFAYFTHKDCGISFVLPKNYEEQKKSSDEARLKVLDEEIVVNCNKKKVAEIRLALADLQEESVEKIGSQKVNIYTAPGNKDRWVMLNNVDQKYVYFLTPKSLTPLIIKTLGFER